MNPFAQLMAPTAGTCPTRSAAQIAADKARSKHMRERHAVARQAQKERIGRYIREHADETGRAPTCAHLQSALHISPGTVVAVMAQLASAGIVEMRGRRWYVKH